ncbi:chitobiase/beta-hexosaminidase C-terminal domain-containing protein [Methanobacterium oryzae]|uniref:chitobiase/beta-hexosaminidase C-terminal domain-containing protein n=1 Tax=Methanobacterium oryzae TaxID=69540 RepID=UPI003D1CFB83
MRINKALQKEKIVLLAAITMMAIIFSVSTVSAATEVYVNQTGLDDPSAGTITNPFATIQYGINQVSKDGTVNIMPGTYTGTGNKEITVTKNVTIIGSGKDNTIIDAQNSGRVFIIENDTYVTIKNLTIKNAKNDAPVGDNSNLGGAIYNKGTLDIENVKFMGNQGHKGSGIANEGVLTVANSTFSGGVDNEWGGAIMNMGILTVTDSTFTSNTAQYEGGAIFNHYEATITGSTFENNIAGTKGGAIFSVSMLYESILEAHNNRFIGNKILNADPSWFLPDLTGAQPNDIYLAAHEEYPYNATMNVTNNWWGSSTGPTTGQIFVYGPKGKSTYSPWLTSDPNNPDKTSPTAYANSKGGLYSYDKNVRLYMSEPGTIYYTLNGITPTTSSFKYTGGPILISSTTTLKFIAVDLAGNLSPVYTEKYTIDKVRPTITSVSIKNQATGVSRTSTIVIKFSENIKTGFNWNKMYVKNLSTGKLIPISRSISGNTLYIKTSTRTANTWYQVYIPGYSVKDSAGNNLASGYWFKFQTGK